MKHCLRKIVFRVQNAGILRNTRPLCYHPLLIMKLEKCNFHDTPEEYQLVDSLGKSRTHFRQQPCNLSALKVTYGASLVTMVTDSSLVCMNGAFFSLFLEKV